MYESGRGVGTVDMYGRGRHYRKCFGTVDTKEGEMRG